MPVVSNPSPPRARRRAFAYRVGVVEADEALAGLAMQCEAVAQPVRTLRRRRHGLDHKSDVMLAVGIDEEHLAVESQQGVKTRVTRSRHAHLCYHPLITIRNRISEGCEPGPGHECDDLRAAHPAPYSTKSTPSNGCRPSGSIRNPTTSFRVAMNTTECASGTQGASRLKISCAC